MPTGFNKVIVELMTVKNHFDQLQQYVKSLKGFGLYKTSTEAFVERLIEKLNATELIGANAVQELGQCIAVIQSTPIKYGNKMTTIGDVMQQHGLETLNIKGNLERTASDFIGQGKPTFTAKKGGKNDSYILLSGLYRSLYDYYTLDYQPLAQKKLQEVIKREPFVKLKEYVTDANTNEEQKNAACVDFRRQEKLYKVIAAHPDADGDLIPEEKTEIVTQGKTDPEIVQLISNEITNPEERQFVLNFGQTLFATPLEDVFKEWEMQAGLTDSQIFWENHEVPMPDGTVQKSLVCTLDSFVMSTMDVNTGEFCFISNDETYVRTSEPDNDATNTFEMKVCLAPMVKIKTVFELEKDPKTGYAVPQLLQYEARYHPEFAKECAPQLVRKGPDGAREVTNENISLSKGPGR